MKLRGSTARVVAALMALALLAVGCSGGSQPAATEAPVATPGSGSGTADDVEAESSANSEEPQEPGEPAAPAEPADLADPADPADDFPAVDPDDPFAVTVLQVVEDVQIVSAFDEPGGTIVELYDVNLVDDIELEYPLYGLTTFGNPLVLLVEEFDNTGEWARVQVPIRPNGTTAWVQTEFFTARTHNFRITIDLSDSMVSVFQGDELLVEQRAVTGSPELPTPVVRTYIDEKIPGEGRNPAFGDWILSLAAFSETLGTFGGGGLPKLALHGTDEPELVGQQVSSGSIRVPNEVVSLIAETVPVGTIVDIVS